MLEKKFDIAMPNGSWCGRWKEEKQKAKRKERDGRFIE